MSIGKYPTTGLFAGTPVAMCNISADPMHHRFKPRSPAIQDVGGAKCLDCGKMLRCKLCGRYVRRVARAEHVDLWCPVGNMSSLDRWVVL